MTVINNLTIWKYSFTLCLAVVLFFSNTTDTIGQDLANIGKGEALKVSGSINANQVLYLSQGIDGRRDPYNYFIAGNLNLSIYGWAIPLSFSYSNQNSSFQQPFNQYGLSPTYKWVTLHAGYRSLSFSKYTLNGHLFLGGGVEVAPTDKIRVSAIYGRFQQAVEEDTTRQGNVPAYRRMAGGVKFTYGDSKDFVDVIIFKAKDDENSLASPPIANNVNPEENLVLGVGFNKTFSKKLVLKAEYASSAISQDIRAEEVTSGNVYDGLSFAFRPRVSSSYYQAVNAAIQYKIKGAGFGLAYERVDPGYRTLGSYFFNNNLENIAFTNTLVAMKNKVRLNWRMGVQRNNLDNEELNTLRRLSGAINVSFMASPKMIYNASYTNFRTVVNFRSQFDQINQAGPFLNLDTLNYKQVAQNANLNANFVLNDSKERRQNLNVNIAYQQSADEQANVEQPTGASFYNINSSYSLSLGSTTTMSAAFNANLTNTIANTNSIIGPSLGIRKNFFDRKLSTNASFSFNNSYNDGILTSRIANMRFSGSFSVKEKHQLALNFTGVSRFSISNSGQDDQQENRFKEFTIQFGYNYSFGN
ncbi:MAG: hypothetical protein WBA74_24750 [Cyclobacteriaceae bacterium]